MQKITFSQNGKEKPVLKPKNTGFTLIEILFVITIISAAAVLAVPNLKKFGESQDLTYASDNLKQGLRIAQSGAISDTKCTTYPVSGWKVNLTSSQFNVVAVCMDPASQTVPGPEIRSTYTFPVATQVSVSDDNCLSTGSVDADIIFSGSSVQFVCLEDDSIVSGPFVITLTNNKSETSTVTVENGGLIY